MAAGSADSNSQKAVRWHPPAFDIRVEQVPIPKIEHPDDAVVKIKLAGLCGSDLHVYRGHEDVDETIVCGHEFVGTVIALGSSFGEHATGRPELYSTLKVGDKVVAPFTASCGECHFCRAGFTCRCIHAELFGVPALPGAQAQYLRVPLAGGTLFKVDDNPSSDSSLLLLADNLPTGAFVALQALQHAKLSPMISGVAFPFSSVVPDSYAAATSTLAPNDRILTFAIVGLGPVGTCAAVSLIEMLADLYKFRGIESRVVAIDPNSARREKMQKIAAVMQAPDLFVVADIEAGKKLVNEWTNSIGCNAVLEVVGNNSALTLAYELVRPFGNISSVGVHQAPPLPFTGRDVYNKNISLDFGRCPVRAMLPIASKILAKRQDVFGDVGRETSLIDKIVGLDEAPEAYELFNKGKCGKILFDPWW